MSKAGKKIIDGLRDAIAVAKGEVEPARVHYPPLISDAVVEAAAQVLRADITESAWNTSDEIRDAIRAAILSDRAETVERCAAIAEDKSCRCSASVYPTSREAIAASQMALSIMDAIRSLSPSPSSKSASTAQEGGSAE